jgi:integrase
MKELELPVGVTIREHRSGRKTLQVAFTFKGHHCRESIGRDLSKPNLRYAADMVTRIRNDISEGRFDYLKHFPKSRQARKILGAAGSTTVSELLTEYLKEHSAGYQESTITGWKSMIKTQINPALGDKLVRDLTTDQITAWLGSKKLKKVSMKYIRNLLTPLRLALYYAVSKNIRSDNPAASNVCSPSACIPRRQQEKGDRPAPFSRSEVGALIAASEEGPVRNLFQFAFASGLRTGELIGLRWTDVDFESRLVRVRQSVVRSREKKPKTSAGRRDVEMSDAALEALQRQLEITGDRVRVFCHPITGMVLKDCDDVYRLWEKVVARAQIRFRPPKQTRHTFASLLIKERGVNLFWLAGQMGHTGIEMINRHYVTYINEHQAYADGTVGTATGHHASSADERPTQNPETHRDATRAFYPANRGAGIRGGGGSGGGG